MRSLAVVALFLVLSGEVLGTPPAIKDGANLFKPPTLVRAASLIDEIRIRYQFDLCIETVKDLPELNDSILHGLRRPEREDLYRKVAQERADELHQTASFTGVYVLLLTKHQRIEIVGWPGDEELKWYGKPYQRSNLRHNLMLVLTEDNPDLHLLVALERYQKMIEYWQPSSIPLVAIFPWVGLSGSLLGIWFLLGIFRRLRARPGLPAPIYQPAVLGSVFGLPAGYWVNDWLFRAERSATNEAPPSSDSLVAVDAPPPETTNP